ncbi:MAG TPA: tetratricopeptide repeat protein [Microlunatus sp.]
MTTTLSAPPILTMTFDTHRRLRGPYSAGGELLRLMVPELLADAPQAVALQANAVAIAAPDLVSVLPTVSKTLTSEAPVGERTRYWSAQRTREVALGIVALVEQWGRSSHPAGLSLTFWNVAAADPTDVELIDLLRLRVDPRTVSVTTCPGPPAGTDHPTGDLADAYVAADGTSSSRQMRAAYEALPADERRRRHSARAAALIELDLPGSQWGAVPYHLELGTDPRCLGVDALLAALLACFNAGFYHACVDLAERGRTLTSSQCRPHDYVHFTQKLIAALSYLDRGEEALPVVRELRGLGADPTDQMRCQYLLAMLYTRHLPPAQRDQAEALACANTAIALADGHADPKRRGFFGAFMRNAAALVDLHRGDLPEALSKVNAAIALTDSALDSEEHRLHRTVLVHNRGRVLLALNDDQGALRDLDEVVRRDPEYDEAYFDRAGVHRARGDLEAARRDYTMAITLSVNFAEAYYNRADTLLELGRAGEALSDLDIVLSLVPDHAEARLNRAGLLIDLGDLGAAEADIDTGLATRPDDAHLWAARGLLQAEQDEPDKAWASYSRSLELDPSLTEALSNRASLAFDLGRVDDALADLDRAIAVGDDLALRLNRGIARQAADDHSGAVSDFLIAAQLGEAPADLWLRLGCSLAALGEYVSAETAWQRCAELSADDPAADDHARAIAAQRAHYDDARRLLGGDTGEKDDHDNSE